MADDGPKTTKGVVRGEDTADTVDRAQEAGEPLDDEGTQRTPPVESDRVTRGKAEIDLSQLEPNESNDPHGLEELVDPPDPGPPGLALPTEGAVGELHPLDRGVIDAQLTSLTDMSQGLTDSFTGKTIGRNNGPGIDDILGRAGKFGGTGNDLRNLPDRHTDDNAPPTGKDWSVYGLPEYVPPKDAQAKTDKLNQESKDKRDASEKFKKDAEDFKKKEYEPPKDDYDTGEGGPTPSWVADATSEPPRVKPGDEVSKPVDPNGPAGGGDAPTIDPSRLPGAPGRPGSPDKDPDYVEASVTTEMPTGRPDDQVTNFGNPDNVGPRIQPSPGPGGGGDPEGGGKGPTVNPGTDSRTVPVGAVVEAAPNQAAPPAPAPVVEQQAPQIAVKPEFAAPPPGAEVGIGPDAPTDDDGIPN